MPAMRTIDLSWNLNTGVVRFFIQPNTAATITGAWPPSSMVTRFMCWPASAASCLPTGVEPVKVILRITGCGIR